MARLRTLSILITFAMTVAIVPVCAAASGCGMECCRHSGDLSMITRGGDCCRVGRAPGDRPADAPRLSPLPARPTLWTPDALFSTSTGTVIGPGHESMPPSPREPLFAATSVPLYLRNTTLLI